MQQIKLTDLINIDDPREYKLHLACLSQDGNHPLDEYVENKDNWLDWNRWRGSRNDWTRKYIFSFIEYYHKTNSYLFGGVFEVKERLADHYEIEEVPAFSKWEARLVCNFHRYQGLRGRAFNLENLIDQFTVDSILPEKYSGERFCGYENVNHSFAVLRSIVRSEKMDWKASLTAVKGVYLIIDKENGKTYVGSAYGTQGIWARLSCYVYTGDGGNDELLNVINIKGKDYAMRNFKFSILEVFAFNTPDEVILQREAYWKNVLISREFGYNRN